MAVNRSLLVFVIVAAMAPAIAFATQFIVGDDAGWKPDFDYEGWANGKQFVVGDSLVFKYPSANHSVYKVNGTDFQNCNVPKNKNLGSFTGNDIINLTAAGNKWYICGTPGHCGKGQKLNITVLESAPAPVPVPVPVPVPAPAPARNAAAILCAKESIFQILLGIIFAIAAMVTVN